MSRISSRIRRKKKEETAKTAIMFPGQGVQALGMAKDISPETLKGLFDQMGETLGEFTASRLSFLVSTSALELPDSEQKKMQLELRQTQNAQLAVFLVSYAQWLEVSGHDGFLMPDFILGHSLGECTAVCAAGALNFRDGLKFVFCRGILMQMATSLERAGMMVVGSERTAGALSIKTIEQCTKGTDVEIANYNSPRELVLSGGLKDLEIVEQRLRVRGVRRTKRLTNVAGAFHHSRYMALVEDWLEDVFPKFGIEIRKPAVPVIFNFTGSPEQDPKRIKAFMAKQPASTLRWQESIWFLIKERVPREHIREIGPGHILTDMLNDFPEFAE